MTPRDLTAELDEKAGLAVYRALLGVAIIGREWGRKTVRDPSCLRKGSTLKSVSDALRTSNQPLRGSTP